MIFISLEMDMIEILKSKESLEDISSELSALKQEVLKQKEPESVKDIPIDQEHAELAKHFFMYMTDFLNKKAMNMDNVNATWKDLNKDIKTSNQVTMDNKIIGRFAVTSYFDQEQNNVVLKNYSTIENNEKIYETEASVHTTTFQWEQALLFKTDDKKYDFDIILHYTGDISVVQKENKHRALKLEKIEDVLKFESLLKEIFPPAYYAYRKQVWEEEKQRDNDPEYNKTKKKKK